MFLKVEYIKQNKQDFIYKYYINEFIHFSTD